MESPNPADVVAFAADVEQIDEISPLNEAATFAVTSPGAALHWGVHDNGQLVGYAQWHIGDQTGVLAVHPQSRRRGIGSALVHTMRKELGDQLALWAFGDSVAAQQLARSTYLTPVRGLHQMSRSLDQLLDNTASPELTIRGFRTTDLHDVWAVNSAAFAHHPEQGRLTPADLQQRMAESWFDPDGLLLALRDDTTIGFHWTKRVSDAEGEVYVLAVSPDAAGHGVGKALLWEGLHHLQRKGCTEVTLFVDANNVPAVKLYERADFAIVRTDSLYHS